MAVVAMRMPGGRNDRRRHNGQWRGRRLLVGLVAAALAAPLSVVGTATWSGPATATPPGLSSPGTGPRATGPHATAERTGRPVEVESLRTETRRVFANPSGTMTMEEHALPVRVRRGGSWVPVDTRLSRRTDGSVIPGATVAGIRLSGGGDADLVTLRRGSAELRLGWSATLPRPVLDGDTATYPDVLPGVDLRVTVEADGFSQVLVVKHEKAARNPALRRLRYPLRATGLTLRTTADGTTIAADRDGRPVFVAATPVMWDTPPAPGTVAEPEARGRSNAPPGRRHAKLTTEFTGRDLLITPDPAMLTGSDGRFPLYIDPWFSGYQYRWTHVNRSYPDQSYWNYDRGEGAKVGYSNWQSPTVTYRSFFQMGTSALGGTRIRNAYFAITLDHSASCTGTWVDLWRTRSIDPAVALTWNNSGGHWLSYLASANGHANESSCPEPDMGMEFASARLKNLVQSIADSRTGHITLGLRAPDEGNNLLWKRFHPGTARIVVEYNTPPRAPTDLNLIRPVPCGSASEPTAIGTGRPQFSATASDPDGHNLATRLRIYRADGTLAHWVDSATTTSGASFAWPAVPDGTLVDGETYYYNAYSNDGMNAGPATGNCYLTLDTVRPLVPGISSTDYPDGEPMIPAGTTGTVTFHPDSSDTDVVEYAYGFQQDRITMRVRAADDGTATVPITVWPHPETGIANLRLYVQAVDAAGNVSDITPAWDLAATDNPNPPPRVAGDTNGDGRPDVTTVIDHGYGRTAVWNVTARDGGFHTGVVAFDTGEHGGFPLYRTRTAPGDYNGDGRTDMAVLREEADRTVSLYLFTSDGNRYRAAAAPLWSIGPGVWPISSARMLSGDVTGDGLTDVVVQRDTGNENWKTLVFPGGDLGAVMTWLQTPSGSSPWPHSAPVLADVDGDGRDDLVSMRNLPGCRMAIKMWRSTGTGFAGTPVTLFDSGTGNWCWIRSKPVAGDFDGDGRDDIAASYDYGGGDTGLWMFRSTGSVLEPGLWWRTKGEILALKAQLSSGDFDLDGRDDLAMVYACCTTGSRQVWTLRSTGGSFETKVLGWQEAVGASTGPKVELEHRSYELVARHSGRCLEIEGGATGNRAVVQQWDCSGGLHQRFRPVRDEGSNHFGLRPVHSVKCADVYAFNQSDGAAIVQWSCNGYTNQQIILEYVEGAAYETVVRLRFRHSGKCAGVAGAALGDGANVVQQTCSGIASQQWILRHAYNSAQLGGRYRMKAEVGSMVLDVTDCQTYDGADVRMWDAISYSPCQKWTVRSLGDDVYEIVDTHTGKLLEISGCSTANAAVVHTWSDTNRDCQRWRIEPGRGGAYTVFALNSGKALDVAGCSSSRGADVIIWPYWGGSCQRWFLQAV